MADVGMAIDYVLGWEDSTLSGVITTNDDRITKTRFGIDQRYHQGLVACGFFSDMGSIAALVIAKGIYAEEYADPLSIEDMANQQIANKVLNLGVNIGITRAAKMLQAAIGVPEDGVIGVGTLMKLASCEPNDVLADLRAAAVSFYRNDVAEHPEKEQFLAGWLTRANA